MSIYVVTYIHVQPNSTDGAKILTSEYGRISREEEGNSGVEVLQEINRGSRFVLLEEWKDEGAFQIHEKARHTAEYRSALGKIQNSPYDQRVHKALAVGSRSRAADETMLCVVTHVDVPPPRKDETEILLKTAADESSKDDGNVKYDVLQQTARPNHFTVVAVWNDANAFTSHETRTHTRHFREALGPMLGAPYDDRLYQKLG